MGPCRRIRLRQVDHRLLHHRPDRRTRSQLSRVRSSWRGVNWSACPPMSCAPSAQDHLDGLSGPDDDAEPVAQHRTQIRLALEAHETISTSRRAIGHQGAAPGAHQRAGAKVDFFPHQFSGGMRQRVAIAIALLHRPKLIICDEPTTALDVSIQAEILTEMKELVSELGTALIWISTTSPSFSSIADRVAVMKSGRIVEIGPALGVLTRPQHDTPSRCWTRFLPAPSLANCCCAAAPLPMRRRRQDCQRRPICRPSASLFGH